MYEMNFVIVTFSNLKAQPLTTILCTKWVVGRMK